MSVTVIRRAAAVGAVALAAITAAGCGGSSSSSSSAQGSSAGGSAAGSGGQHTLASDEQAVSGLSDAAREQKLLSLAKQEGGSVSVYTSLTKLAIPPVEKAWKRKYPGVTLNLYRASSEDVATKVLAEKSANHSGADVAETNGTEMLTFQQKGALAKTPDSPYAQAIPQKYRFQDFTADRVEKFVAAWNTNVVKSPPKSWQDLTSSAYAGKIAMEPGDVDWFAALYKYMTSQGGMSKSQADTFFATLASNAQIIKGHTNQASMLAAGQVGLVASAHAQSLEDLQAKKAPVAFKPFLTPVIERPQGIGIVKGASHPAAALLFYDFMLMPSTQKVLQANGVDGANPKYGDPEFSSHPQTISMDIRDIVSNYKKWQSKYDQIVQNGTKSGA